MRGFHLLKKMSQFTFLLRSNGVRTYSGRTRRSSRHAERGRASPADTPNMSEASKRPHPTLDYCHGGEMGRAGRIAQTAGEKNRDPKARTSLGDDRPLQLGKHTHCYCRPNKKAWKKMEEHAGIFGPDRWAATERSGGNLVTFLPIAIER
jgi:hypothetical protein